MSTTSAAMPKAVVYKTASNYERKGIAELEQHGVSAFTHYDESGDRARVTAPGYIFANRAANVAFLKHVRGKPLGFARLSEIDNLHVMKPKPVPKARPFAVGDRVEISLGPFASMIGTISKDRGRVFIVNVEGLNVSSVSVHPGHMIRIDPG